MDEDAVYDERLSSPSTTGLFVALTLVSCVAFVWLRASTVPEALRWVSLGLACLFAFYSLNYRVLRTLIDSRQLRLRFGLFGWTVPLDNVEDCAIDIIPRVMAMGGAGIHFMLIDGRYRASLNFLDHPRVVVRLRRKMGPVQDVSFSTRRPHEIVRLLRPAAGREGGGSEESAAAPESGRRGSGQAPARGASPPASEWRPHSWYGHHVGMHDGVPGCRVASRGGDDVCRCGRRRQCVAPSAFRGPGSVRGSVAEAAAACATPLTEGASSIGWQPVPWRCATAANWF